MNKKEAKEILGLVEHFEPNDLKKCYNQLYVSTFRKKSASMTMLDAQSLERRLAEFNTAYNTLIGNEHSDNFHFLIHFGHHQLPEETTRSIERSDRVRKLEEELKDNQHLLLLQILEIHIEKFLSGALEYERVHFDDEVRLLGKVLIELGLINQGLDYFNYGLLNHQKAVNYRKIGDYRSAIHYFGKELKHPSGHFPIDEICQQISISYFLLGEYENALHVIEDILPHLLPKKQIFEEACKWKDFATQLMVSMHKLGRMEGTPLEKIKIRVKYPVSSKYLTKCFGSIGDALKEIEKFEESAEAYEEFLNTLKPGSIVKEHVRLEYTNDEMREHYFRYFGDSIEESQIYSPLKKKRS